jgi:hypothetical protein
VVRSCCVVCSREGHLDERVAENPSALTDALANNSLGAVDLQ